jgi:hypothetical protein
LGEEVCARRAKRAVRVPALQRPVHSTAAPASRPQSGRQQGGVLAGLNCPWTASAQLALRRSHSGGANAKQRAGRHDRGLQTGNTSLTDSLSVCPAPCQQHSAAGPSGTEPTQPVGRTTFSGPSPPFLPPSVIRHLAYALQHTRSAMRPETRQRLQDRHLV